MITSKAVRIPMIILLVALIRQVAVQWGENTNEFMFYLFGAVFLTMVIIYSFLVPKRNAAQHTDK